MKGADAPLALLAFQISEGGARLAPLAYQTSAAVVHHARPVYLINMGLVVHVLLVDPMGDRLFGNKRR